MHLAFAPQVLTEQEVSPIGVRPSAQFVAAHVVEYGGSDLSQAAIAYRQAQGITSGRNVAVFEYRAGDGSLQHISAASQRGVGHAERILGRQLEDMGISASQVTRI